MCQENLTASAAFELVKWASQTLNVKLVASADGSSTTTKQD
jgi:hypothetical protein